MSVVLLTLQDLAIVRRSVWPARIKWFEMGVKLKLNTEWLESLRERFSNDPKECLTTMLVEWLKGAKPTWVDLNNALRDPSVGMVDIATNIARKHIDPSAFGLREASGFSKPGSRKTFKDKSTQTDVNVHHICCSCSKCRGPRRYPQPINLRGSNEAPVFPFLKTEGLREDDREDLEATLVSDSNKMIHRFADLIWQACKSIEDQKIPIVTMKKYLLELGAFEEGTRPQIPLMCRHQDEFTNANSSAEVFMHLIEYFSFCNYHVLEYIIFKMGTMRDQEAMEDFLVHFNQYAKRSVFEIQPGAVGQSPSYRHHCKKLCVRLKKVSDIKLDKALVVRERIAKILGMNPLALYISRVELEEGCVQFIFLLPKAVKESLCPIEPERVAKLEENDMELISKPDEPPPVRKPKVGESHNAW